MRLLLAGVTAALALQGLAETPSPIDVDLGRQLFVDDFLVEKTEGVTRIFPKPVKYEGNPVLRPETALERHGGLSASARPCGGGIWWDPKSRAFRYWYEAGFLRTVGYAETTNGVDFVRPEIRSKTNQALESDIRPDSWEVLPDFEREDPFSNWVMYLRGPGGVLPGFFFESEDGRHFGVSRRLTGASGDRSNLYYDPFRGEWVFALRDYRKDVGRCVSLRTAKRIREGLDWDFAFGKDEPWLTADKADQPDPAIGSRPELYAFNAVAYESLMVGAFEILLGPHNLDCAKKGLPKITDVKLGYSRDGRMWMRPDCEPFLASERWGSGKWDTGYVQMVGNLFTVREDELWFYYGAVAGDTNRLSTVGHNFPENGMYHNAATGLAKLRRDGFAAFTGTGTVLTKPIVFSGSRLFANFKADWSLPLSVEVLDVGGKTLAAFGPFTADSTKFAVGDVAAFAGRPVRLRFRLNGCRLYSFWVSADVRGHSGGYLGGGGPDSPGVRDVAPTAVREAGTRDFAAEIVACAAKGGGRVTVPAGCWKTGRIELKSNVELHLEDGAELLFTDDPQAYLPVVLTSWEGVECYNYSPLVYALDATNVAITGKGRLVAEMGTWRTWGGTRKPSAEAAKQKLLEWGRTDAPVAERDLTKLPGSNLRPPFIGLNRCNGIRLEGFALRNSPFWCIHILQSENVVLRKLDLKADINNSDGANFECTKHVLVEDCVFAQGDDVVCCKAGLDRDGRRRGISTEDVLVRRCRAKAGHGFLTIGSECSGGVRNVTMEDCEIEGRCDTLFNIKTRPTRGGFIENVRVSRVKAKEVDVAVFNITTSNSRWLQYEVGEPVLTGIRGLMAEDITVTKATRLLSLRGAAGRPIRDVRIRNVRAEETAEPDVVENAEVVPSGDSQ